MRGRLLGVRLTTVLSQVSNSPTQIAAAPLFPIETNGEKVYTKIVKRFEVDSHIASGSSKPITWGSHKSIDSDKIEANHIPS